MAVIRKVERFVLDQDGRKVPLMRQGTPVLVTRGRHKGMPRYQTAPYLDGRGRPRWQATVYDKVARKPISKVFLREKDAQQWVRAQEGRKEHREQLTGDRRTVAEYLTWWLEMKAKGAVAGKRGRKRRAPRSRTMQDYRELVEKWITHPPAKLPALARVRLDELSHRDLDDFYAAMLDVVTAGSVRRFHGLLVQAFEEAVRKGYLPHNPADRASVPQSDDHGNDGEDNAISQAMDEQQAAGFLKAARAIADAQEQDGERVMPERCWSALWHVLMLAALRPGEAFGLTWDDVRLDDKAAVHVRRTLVRIRRQKGWRLEQPKTKNGVRVVPLPALAVRELKAWRTMQKRQRLLAGDQWEEHGFAFTTSKGTPLGGARRSFERVCSKTELGECSKEHSRRSCWCPEKEHGAAGPLPAREFKPAFRIYDLRHTCITLWLRAGVPVHVASKLAGHATAAFTLTVYAKALPDQKLEAAAKMDALFGT